MPPRIRSLAQKILRDPFEVNIAISKPPERIRQELFIVYEPQKNPLVKRLLKDSPFRSILVFCSRKQSVKQLTRDLKRAGFHAEEIHSDLDQSQREEVLRQFASKHLPILVATDILSRGIDIDQIELVINYDVPHDGEDYVHRIGRTARAETDGTAYTFVTDKELRRMAQIEKLIGREIPRATIPPELGPTPGNGPAPAPDRHPGGGRPGQRRQGPPPGSGGRGSRPGGGQQGGGPKGRPSRGGSGPRPDSSR
jgi:superfamily II DNA/RNA helicase